MQLHCLEALLLGVSPISVLCFLRLIASAKSSLILLSFLSNVKHSAIYEKPRTDNLSNKIAPSSLKGKIPFYQNGFNRFRSKRMKYSNAMTPDQHPIVYKKQSFYGIKKGKEGFCGIVLDWETCQKFTKGIASAEYKRFDSITEAAAFITGAAHPTAAGGKEHIPSLSESKEVENVYTDGACEGNGRANARAGYGVWFGPDGLQPISMPLDGKIQTNQRAEMMAVICALEILINETRKSLETESGVEKIPLASSSKSNSSTLRPIVIWSDSQYTVKGVKSWVANWKNNQWKTANNTPVKNKDLWIRLDKNLDHLQTFRSVDLRWVRGHEGNPGNEIADRLAVAGIRKQTDTSRK